MQLPNLPGLNLQLPSLGAGPAVSGATSNAGLSAPIISPFTFDNSNWQVSLKSSGSLSANSKSGADSEANGGTGGSGGTAGGLEGGFGGGLNMPLIVAGLGAWFLLR